MNTPTSPRVLSCCVRALLVTLSIVSTASAQEPPAPEPSTAPGQGAGIEAPAEAPAPVVQDVAPPPPSEPSATPAAQPEAVPAPASETALAPAPSVAPAPAPSASPAPSSVPLTPAPLYAPSAPRYAFDGAAPRPRVSRGMMITGISMLAGGYLLSSMIGIVAVQYDRRECTDCEEVGPLMFVPVLGPFLAVGPADGGEPVYLLLGTVELVGAGLMAGGIVKYKRSKRAAQQGAIAWELSRGRSLALDVSTSPRFSGSTVRLSF